MHPLLARQLRRYIVDDVLLERLQGLFSAVSDAYAAYENDKEMTERSLDLMSKELTSKNNTLRNELKERQKMEAELRENNAALGKINLQLEAAQSQLLQSEKMASIGQLAAGVAHEINNPIGFVNSNMGTLKAYCIKLSNAIAALQVSCDPEVFSDVDGRFELGYIMEDLPVLLQESMEGIDRVKKIVQDLKDFSHVDSTEWVFIDVNKSIDSTINIARNEIKYKADVLREYEDLPEVELIGSQFNQVILNLLVNAAHAIKARGTITVRTRSDSENMFVDVIDTGSGIPTEYLTRIFDPFFTTKPVGQGTGLGLSLAFSIMKKMYGDIKVESELGKGTCFTLRIPWTAAAQARLEN